MYECTLLHESLLSCALIHLICRDACRLGSVARKQGNPSVCKDIISNMYGYNAMEVQEAFNKIREQARAFLAQPEQLVGGLNLVNQQDLGYFQPLHQAELFRLKGIFLQVG